MLIVDAYLTIKRRNKEKQIDTGYVQTDEGIRIIAVKPDTPAAKMNLHAGDTILTCNNIPVNTEDEFYRAIQKNAAYCHIKAKTYGGDLIIVESAIFKDSPHEIGLVLFR
ncbi:PDZ domain-containing protein [Ligilactobacillus hayakitensis]|nr:PDZ domain-containing protein [Ligilactobacillus hayakitensis]